MTNMMITLTTATFVYSRTRSVVFCARNSHARRTLVLLPSCNTGRQGIPKSHSGLKPQQRYATPTCSSRRCTRGVHALRGIADVDVDVDADVCSSSHASVHACMTV